MPYLEVNAKILWRNITRPLSRGDLFGLFLTMGVALMFAYQQSVGLYTYKFDFGNYLNSAHGDFSHYYYAYWLLPVFYMLDKLPFPLAYFIWNGLNILGVFFASRVFGGKALWVLTSYQMFYTIFQGNITGILVGMLALLWYSLISEWWIFGGLAFLVACTKYQLGIPFGLLLITLAPSIWRKKIRIFIIPILVAITSILIWGFWPLKVLETVQNYPPNASGNSSLWNLLGVLALILWIPPLILKLPLSNRLSMLFSAIFLGLPYLQQSDLIALFVFIPTAFALFGNLGYVLAVIRFDLLQYMFIVPLGLYIWSLLVAYFSRSHSFQAK